MDVVPGVPGLFFQRDFVTPEFEATIIQELDAREWSTELARRTQHYGYRYDYKKRAATHTPAPPITGSLKQIADIFDRMGIMNPEQVIVNEYTRTQGIAAHIDNLGFGPIVISVSLLAPTEFIFTPAKGQPVAPVSFEVPRGSVLVMTGESRYDWTHEIPKRVRIMVDGQPWTKPNNYRRISLTYRTLAR